METSEQPSENRSMEWIPDTTDRQGRERGIFAYEGYLGIKKEDLSGKRVLDLGSGEKGKFARELKESDVRVDLVMLNPDLKNEKYRESLSEGFTNRQAVAAVGQALPFRENSFDMVLALFSLTVFAPPDDRGFLPAALKWSNEIARVLKPGGEARLAPIIVDSENEFKEGAYKPLIEIWNSKGLEILWQRIKNKDLGLTGPRIVITPSGEESTESYPEYSWYSRIILKKPEK